MKSTFVWGFDKNCEDIILDLQSKNIIEVKAWIKEFNESKNFCYNVFDFFSDSWLDKYKKELHYYTQNIKFQESIYKKLYEKIYTFQDFYSRHDIVYQERKFDYYLNMFNLLYKFILGIFEKEQIKLVLLSNIPHEGPELIIYEIAKFFNIKTIILNQSPFANKLFYMDNIEDYGSFKTMYKQSHDSNFKIEKIYYKEHWYMKNIEPYNYSFWTLIKKSLRKPLKIINTYSYEYPKYKSVKRYIKNIKKYTNKVDYNKKFVYFPLHLQPELTTSALGGIFCDQLLALEILSELIPKDWIIYVKENPKQTEFMRSDTFFKRLNLIKKAKLTPGDENTFKLIEKSQFVATITGTAAWEAISGGKPALIFGNIWFENLTGIFKYSKDFKLDNLLNFKINHNQLEKEVNDLINKAGNGVIDPDYEQEVENYSKSQNTISVSTLLQELIQKEENEISVRDSTIRA